MDILLLITGGTIDKEYDELREELIFRETHVPKMLQLGRSTVDVEIRTLMLIDSLYMSEDDRQLIAKECLKAHEERILITHGTGTIAETANVLRQKVREKTVVLTGSMSPFANGKSDALFNLGCAIAFVQSLPHGVYVVMNGKAFEAGDVKKSLTSGYFEAITHP